MSRFFNNRKRGFTLTELIVTVGIMGVILTVIAVNQGTYTEQIALANLADKMSLTLTQSQSYGIAVKELVPGSQNFSAAYGMSISLLSSGSPSSYISFADRNVNGAYDGDWTCVTGGTAECLEKVDVGTGNTISSICIVDSNGSEDCSSPKRADITFKRPNVEANFAVFNQSGQLIDTSTAKAVKVGLTSRSGYERSVVAYKVGQISALKCGSTCNTALADGAVATLTASTVNIYLGRADLMRATKSATCTTSINTGCSWAVVSTTNPATDATLTSAVGATVSTNNLTVSGNAGWDAGAISSDTITSGNGYVEFTTSETNYKMGGLGSGDADQHYTDIEYAVYMIVGGTLGVFESGTYRGNLGTYVAGDHFRVAIESGVVKYYKNDAVFYTSSVTPTAYPYRFDSSFYGTGGTINNITLSSANSNLWTGTMFNTLSSGTYIYELKVYDNSTPVQNMSSEPARIEVSNWYLTVR